MTHLEQIQRAVDFIEEHLHDELNVDDIARAAGFSRWHFQLVFSSAVGDTLKEYIRARRLTHAMHELQTEKRLIDIALDAGFESQESFTRAFKNMYQQTPGECRKNGSILPKQKPKITFLYLDHLYKGVSMEPLFKFLDEKKVVGIKGKFISVLSPEKNNMIVIPQLWGKYMPRRHEIKNTLSKFDMGVCFEMPAAEKTHPEECTYMACTEVSTFDSIPEGMESFVIPSGNYAVFTHKGELAKFEMTMGYIYGSWLPKSGKKLRSAPDIEMYDERFKLNQPDSEIDIYIPIE